MTTEATAFEHCWSMKDLKKLKLFTEPSAQWGKWEWQDNLTILYDNYYEIDLERINSNAEIVDWIFQCASKDVEGLINAFADIFNPQRNCCSFGVDRQFSGSKLAKKYAQRLKPIRQPMSVKLRYSILERDGFCCRAYGATPDQGATLHVDHIHPVSKGGSNDPDNLQTLCAACNLGKGARV